MRKSLGRLSYDNYMPIRPLGKTIPHCCNNQGDACTSTQYAQADRTAGHSSHMFYNRINNNDLLILTGWEKGLHARHSEPVFFCLLLLLFVVVVVLLLFFVCSKWSPFQTGSSVCSVVRGSEQQW